MYRHIAFIAQCLSLFLPTASPLMIPNFYASASNNYNQYILDGHHPTEDYAKHINTISYVTQHPPSADDSHQSHEQETGEEESKHNSDLEFQNNEWKDEDLKSPFKDLKFGEKLTHPVVDPENPHLIKVPVPQPYPVHIPVEQPFTVPIYKLVPEEVEKKIPIHVEKLVPVYKEKPVKFIVEKHYPVHVLKPYFVPVQVNTHILHEKKKLWH